MATRAAPILERILDARRAAVSRLQKSGSSAGLEERARGAPVARDFRRAISGSDPALIAECKQRSPSAGALQLTYDPVRLAQRYAAGGAAAISVLTEPEFFGGSMDHLRSVRQAVELPVLCKDFIVDRLQLLEARAAGADAVLLIVAVLDENTLPSLHSAALELGLQALVEVHDEAEVERALALKPAMIGINNRDLTRMRTESGTTARLRPLIPVEQTVVSESGIQSRADMIALRRAGVDAALVGESLLRASNLEDKLRELTGR
ncbi:MAG: indole-3-glycerol phosphate synthase TrpC [Candidatus Dormibacteraeota bacterium]|nr:indole-3-glycerol phosphate synthase TrpC [Candidatus Dormibacteraeota bacterium]